jgi:hypothetical protein
VLTTVGLRVAAAACSLFWAVAFFGIVDLSVVVDPGGFLPDVALEASWGALFTFFVAGALLAVAVRPGAAGPAAAQLLLVAVALGMGCVGASDPGPLPVAAVLAVTAALLVRGDARVLLAVLRAQPRPVLAAVAVAAAPFWLLHAWHAVDAGRSRSPSEADLTWGIDHWPVHGATALTIGAAAVLAALCPVPRRLLAATACFAGAVLGAASLAYPDSNGAMLDRSWSLAAVLWSITIGLLGVAGPPAGDPRAREGPAPRVD